MSAMNDLFADLDDDVLSPLDDASTSHTHNNGASRYSLGGDSASASTSTLNHHHHQQLAHHLDQHHHQQQHLHQPLAMDTSASQSMRPGGAAAPPVWMNQDLPSWLSKQQAAPVSFAASAAEVYTNHQHKSPIFFFFFFFFFSRECFSFFFFFFFFFFPVLRILVQHHLFHFRANDRVNMFWICNPTPASVQLAVHLR
jgi:hypothetical protein